MFVFKIGHKSSSNDARKVGLVTVVLAGTPPPPPKKKEESIPKTIGNRKEDCAWNCSRWQAQPEKICKSQLCALQFADFLRLCLSPRTTSRTISFSISNSFWYWFDSFFRYLLSRLLAVLSPGLFGYVLLYLGRCAVATVLFVALAAGLWCFTAGCHTKSPVFPNPLSNRSVLHGHDDRKHKTLVFLQTNANKQCTSYKFAAPRYRLPYRLFK